MRPRLDNQDIDARHRRREVQTPAERDSIAAMVHSQCGEVWLGERGILRVVLLLDEDGSGGGSNGAGLGYEFSKRGGFRRVIACAPARYELAIRSDRNVQTYRQTTAWGYVIGAIGEVLKVGREEFIRNSGINVDEELLDSRHDLGSSMVAQAARAGEMAIVAVPVITAVVGECMRGGKGEEQQGQDGHKMHD